MRQINVKYTLAFPVLRGDVRIRFSLLSTNAAGQLNNDCKSIQKNSISWACGFMWGRLTVRPKESLDSLG